MACRVRFVTAQGGGWLTRRLGVALFICSSGKLGGIAVLTCTWAPTVFGGMEIVGGTQRETPTGADLSGFIQRFSEHIESLGLSHLLIAQRWWGSGVEMESSSLDCTAMTALFAAYTSRTRLVTAIHPGFFHPAVLAKWAVSIDRLTAGRWSINVTSGWNLAEFDMFGIDPLEHDQRYARSIEFIELLRGVWANPSFSYEGEFFKCDGLELEPRPTGELEIFQGGQSDAAIAMAAAHSDWMFLNGGSLEKTKGIIDRVRAATRATGRDVKFALYGHPLCRKTDAEAWQEIEARVAALDPELRAKRRGSTSGAQGMWADDDNLSHLDTNEGFSSRLIGSPETIMDRIEAFSSIGVDMLHLALGDPLFEEQVFPALGEV